MGIDGGVKEEGSLYGLFNYVRTGMFQVVYLHSPLVGIASVTLLNIRKLLLKIVSSTQQWKSMIL
jgi:hypothetical protein